MRFVVLALLGAVISTVLALGGAIDAEFARSAQPPSTLCAIWRGFTPESWGAAQAYDPATASAGAASQRTMGSRLNSHRSSLLWGDRLVLLDIGRGLFDSVRVYECISARTPPPEWRRTLDETMRSRAWLPSFPAKSLGRDEGANAIARCEPPQWLAAAVGEEKHGLAIGVLQATGGWSRLWLARPQRTATQHPLVESTIASTAITRNGRRTESPIGDLAVPQDPVVLSEMLSEELLESGLTEIRLWECRAYGWPLRCFVVHGERMIELGNPIVDGPGGAQLRESLYSDGVPLVAASAPPRPPFYDSPAIGIPTRVSWIPFTLNAIAWAAALWVSWRVPALLARAARWVRGTLQGRRGNCRACGYPRTGLARGAACPECGGE